MITLLESCSGDCDNIVSAVEYIYLGIISIADRGESLEHRWDLLEIEAPYWVGNVASI